MKPQIELARPRNFSEIVNDTFTFVRQNFKPLVKCYFVFCGFFLIAGALFSCMQQLRAIDVFNHANAYGTETANAFRASNYFNINFLLSIVFTILTYFAIQITVLSYISLYKEKGNIPPTVTEVWGYIRYFFMRTLWGWFVQAILLTIATMFCIVPGVWLYPIFAFILPIMIFENASFGYAFNHCFRLIKDYWWITFGTLIVIVIIAYMCAAAVVLPASLASTVSLFMNIKRGVHFSAGLLLTTVLLGHIAYVFYMIPAVTIALCYFSLNEVKEGTGILKRIQHFGEDDTLSKSNPE